MRGELLREVSATGGKGRPNLRRNPNGMAVVAQFTKSVNTNRQEVRLVMLRIAFLIASEKFGSSVLTPNGNDRKEVDIAVPFPPSPVGSGSG